MRTPRYWTFTLLFWLGAGVLMFLRGLTDHWDQVLMRFLYYPILGVALCAVMTLVFQSDRFESLRWPALWAGALSAVSALITAMILNPITYLILGIDLIEDHLRKMTTGYFGFAVTYLFWCVLYFELDGRPLLGPSRAAGHLVQIEVDDRGSATSITVGEIEALAASGDYVSIQLADRSYLKKATISSMAGLLDPSVFKRIHRSTIVNAQHVDTVSPRGGGSFDVTLRSGRVVSSSRSYRAVVEGLL